MRYFTAGKRTLLDELKRVHKMKRIIGSLFAILAIAMFVMACGDDNDGLKCGADEVKMALKVGDVVGEEKCYKTCDTTADCPSASTQECRGAPKVCRDKAVVGTNNKENNKENNDTPETPTISAENKELCEDYCDLNYGCVTTASWCGAGSLPATVLQECLNGFASRPEDKGCFGELTGTSADAAKIEAAAADYRSQVYNQDGTKVTCDDVSYLKCAWGNEQNSCGCEPSQKLGAACVNPEDCESGSLLGACIGEKSQDNTDTGYKGGYCLSIPCELGATAEERQIGLAIEDSLACGAGNYCVFEQYTQDSVLGFCYASCESTANDDCREGYACQASAVVRKDGKSVMAKTCRPANCAANADCKYSNNVEGRCNMDTKACEAPCNKPEEVALCESGNGVCEGDDGAKFCVLP